MNVVKTVEEVREAVRRVRQAGRSIGFVPTLGGMHEGHFSLIRAAREACDFVAVSIFLNPTQFGPKEDLASYPSTPQADLEASRSLGVGLVFMPTPETMHGHGALTDVTVKALSATLCGASRPWHFGGVCTVVAKLFNIVQPDKAFFGSKDFQQAVIIRRMVLDLNFPVEIVVCPTVREPDGLAMSSRNAYLTPDQRRQAPALQEAMKLAQRLIAQRRPPAAEVVRAVREHLAAKAPEGVIDYVSLVDPETLQDVETTDRKVLVALAVKLGRARLIDNVVVEAPSSP